jgi:hypothetical protein
MCIKECIIIRIKGSNTMNTVRLNITFPSSVNDDITRYAQELNEKKSHLIVSALDMYFDYIDLKEAEKRLEADEPTLSLNEMRKELGL